jgi:hypothetical protein
MGERKEIFITVKTYPHPSNTYGELVCVAGIEKSGNLIRLYPLRYRTMQGEQQFSKYQWIDVEVEKNSSDNRPESYRVVQPSIKLLKKVNDNVEKEKIILGDRILPTMCSLSSDAGRLNRSLAIVKPVIVEDFFAEEDSPEWSAPQKEALRKILLWEVASRPLLEKIPYKFYYKYKCCEPNCRGHQQSIYDWELFALYRKYKDKQIAITKVKEKFYTQMCDKKKNLHFFVGTHSSYPAWIILGTFWPNKKTTQLTLLC